MALLAEPIIKYRVYESKGIVVYVVYVVFTHLLPAYKPL